MIDHPDCSNNRKTGMEPLDQAAHVPEPPEAGDLMGPDGTPLTGPDGAPLTVPIEETAPRAKQHREMLRQQGGA